MPEIWQYGRTGWYQKEKENLTWERGALTNNNNNGNNNNEEWASFTGRGHVHQKMLCIAPSDLLTGPGWD